MLIVPTVIAESATLKTGHTKEIKEINNLPEVNAIHHIPHRSAQNERHA